MGLGLLAVAAAVVVVVIESAGDLGDEAIIAEAFGAHDRILVVGAEGVGRYAPRGADVVTADHAPEAIASALSGADPSAFVAALRAEGIEAVLVDSRPGDAGEFAPSSVRAGLVGYPHVPGLTAVALVPGVVVYEIDDVEALVPAHAEALAHVARRVLAGDRPPRIASFPEPLRRVRNVEIMVLLREGSRARLWRSARGSSLARALTTAAVVARQRWAERSQAMGGDLDELLPRFAVEVVLLSEDGTLGSRSEAFVERAFSAEHGVAFERRGTWHYQLPSARPDEPGAVMEAYRALFSDNGLQPEALDREDLRPYRLVATPLAVSAPSPGTAEPDDGAAGSAGSSPLPSSPSLPSGASEPSDEGA